MKKGRLCQEPADCHVHVTAKKPPHPNTQGLDLGIVNVQKCVFIDVTFGVGLGSVSLLVGLSLVCAACLSFLCQNKHKDTRRYDRLPLERRHHVQVGDWVNSGILIKTGQDSCNDTLITEMLLFCPLIFRAMKNF